MRHLRLWAAFALSAGVALASGVARADDGDCADFRNKILAADARGEVFLGYYRLRNQLGLLYTKFCPSDPPVRLTDEQYAKVCGGPVPDDPDQRAEMLQVCAVQGGYPDQPPSSDFPDMSVPGRIPPNGMSAASAWAGQIAKDPGYQRMCKEAAANENTCRQHQANMRTCTRPDPNNPQNCVADGPVGTAGQAGAFGDCAALYQGVLDMCHGIDRGAAAPPAASRPPQAVKAVPPAPPPAKANPNAPQASSAPPPKMPPPAAPDPRAQQAVASLSPQCKSELNAMMQGADSGDGQKATSAYGALRTPQCDAALRSLAATAGLGLPERKMSSRLRGLADSGMRGDDGGLPGAAANAAAQGGGSFDTGQVLDFAFALLGVMSGVAGGYTPMAGGHFATRMGSIGNRPVQSTYGQGASTYRPAPPSSQSTITGVGSH